MSIHRMHWAQLPAVYTCHYCGRQHEGTKKVGVLIRAGEVVPEPETMPAYMPIGWASFFKDGGIIYRCSSCKEKTS